jgi:hypothetical protein
LFSEKVDFSSAVGEADVQEVDTLLAWKRGVGYSGRREGAHFCNACDVVFKGIAHAIEIVANWVIYYAAGEGGDERKEDAKYGDGAECVHSRAGLKSEFWKVADAKWNLSKL